MRKWLINKKSITSKIADSIKHELRVDWEHILDKYFHIVFDNEEYIMKNLITKDLLSL